jgi:hypothetical protein
MLSHIATLMMCDSDSSPYKAVSRATSLNLVNFQATLTTTVSQMRITQNQVRTVCSIFAVALIVVVLILVLVVGLVITGEVVEFHICEYARDPLDSTSFWELF